MIEYTKFINLFKMPIKFLDQVFSVKGTYTNYQFTVNTNYTTASAIFGYMMFAIYIMIGLGITIKIIKYFIKKCLEVCE